MAVSKWFFIPSLLCFEPRVVPVEFPKDIAKRGAARSRLDLRSLSSWSTEEHCLHATPLPPTNPIVPNVPVQGVRVKFITRSEVFLTHESWHTDDVPNLISISHAHYNRLLQQGDLSELSLTVVLHKNYGGLVLSAADMETLDILKEAEVKDKMDLPLYVGHSYRSAKRSGAWIYLGMSPYTGDELFVSATDTYEVYSRELVEPYHDVGASSVSPEKCRALLAQQSFSSKSLLHELNFNPEVVKMSVPAVMAHPRASWDVLEKGQLPTVSIALDVGTDFVEEMISLAWESPLVQARRVFVSSEAIDTLNTFDEKLGLVLQGPQTHHAGRSLEVLPFSELTPHHVTNDLRSLAATLPLIAQNGTPLAYMLNASYVEVVLRQPNGEIITESFSLALARDARLKLLESKTCVVLRTSSGDIIMPTKPVLVQLCKDNLLGRAVQLRE